MAVPIPTTLDQIVLAVRTQLMAWPALSLPAERCLVTDPAKLTFHPEGDAYLWIWPDFESADLPVLFGAGRLDCRMAERIEVGIRSRFAVDESSSALAWLTDATLGHCPLRTAVWDALIQWLPTDAVGNALTVEPLVPARGARPRLDPAEKEWGESVLAFEATYILALTQSVQ